MLGVKGYRDPPSIVFIPPSVPPLSGDRNVIGGQKPLKGGDKSQQVARYRSLVFGGLGADMQPLPTVFFNIYYFFVYIHTLHSSIPIAVYVILK